MANRIIGSLQLRSVEQKQVLLMLCTGFFMGAFIATYQVTADSLFLNRLGQYLDKAFLVAGGLGIMTTALFTTFQNWIKFSALVLISILLIFGFTVAVYVLLHYGSPEWQTPLLFIMYCMNGPMTAVLLLSFWGIFGRLFNFRQSKRIIGWIDTGQLIAAIGATFSIPLTAKIVPDTSNYLLLCAGSVLLCFVLMVAITSRFDIAKNNPREFGSTVRKETSLPKLLRNPYVLLLSSFLFISMITFVFNQYAFQQLIKEQYPGERELTNFNAFFTGSVYGLSLLMQTFVNNKIISNYGLRISLFLLPIIVGIFSLGSLVTGLTMGFDKQGSPAGFVFFFLFISISRLFNWTIRDSLENPVFKLFFIPLDSRLRFNIQTKVEGLVNESARFITGLLIFGFAFLPFFKVIHISVILLILVGIYFIVVNRIYNGYRSQIREKLESSELQQEKLEKGFTRVMSKLEEMLVSPTASKAVFSFRLLEKINSANVPAWINALMKNTDESARQYAQERMNEVKGLSVSDKYVIRVDDALVSDQSRNLLSKGDLRMIIENGGDITKARVQKLSRSSNPDDRHYAAELLLHTSLEECTGFLMELLFDSEAKVRNTAIKTAVKKNSPEIINALIDNLGDPVFSSQAMNALVLIGAPTLQALESAFYRSGQATQVMLRLIQVMGRIGGQKAKDMLWSKIDYPNKLIVSHVLLSLGECGFKAGISQITRIKYAIEADIADIRWNLSAIQEIGDEGFADRIKDSLRWEIQNDIEHIYMLLAMLYDTRSIQLVKENIDTGTGEGITYAVELLDVFLSDQLKQRVIPVLDDISDNERINRLDAFYPRVKLDSKLVLKFMINRDFTQANRWTKACILFQIGTQRIEDFKLDLTAQIFNPDGLIREISAWALNQIDPVLYQQNVLRLGVAKKRELDDLILHSAKMTVFEKVLFYQRIPVFEDTTGVTLSYLADISSEIRLPKGSSLTLDAEWNNDFYVVVSGSVKFFQRGEEKALFKEGQFIGEMLSMGDFPTTNFIVAQSDLVALRFNKDPFYEILSDNVTLSDRILEYI
jgi:Cyclic nucleotide-binding domain